MAKKQEDQSMIESLLNDYKKNISIISQEIDEEAHRATLGARLANKKQAVERNKQVRFDIQNELLSKSIFILVDGNQANEFVSIANKEYGCFSFSDRDFFEELLEPVNSTYYISQYASSSLYDIINGQLQMICPEIGIASYPLFDMREKDRVPLNSKEDLINAVSNLFYEQLGGEIIGAFFLQKTTERLIQLDDFKGKSVPLVVVSNNSLQLSKGLRNINRNTFLVRASSEKKEDYKNSELYIANLDKVSQDKVEKTLLNIKKQLA